MMVKLKTSIRTFAQMALTATLLLTNHYVRMSGSSHSKELNKDVNGGESGGTICHYIQRMHGAWNLLRIRVKTAQDSRRLSMTIMHASSATCESIDGVCVYTSNQPPQSTAYSFMDNLALCYSVRLA